MVFVFITPSMMHIQGYRYVFLRIVEVSSRQFSRAYLIRYLIGEIPDLEYCILLCRLLLLYLSGVLPAEWLSIAGRLEQKTSQRLLNAEFCMVSRTSTHQFCFLMVSTVRVEVSQNWAEYIAVLLLLVGRSLDAILAIFEVFLRYLSVVSLMAQLHISISHVSVA